MMRDATRDNKKVIYHRKFKTNTNEPIVDPITRQFKQKLIAQAHNVSLHASALQTHYGSFLPARHDSMSKTSTSFRGRSEQSLRGTQPSQPTIIWATQRKCTAPYTKTNFMNVRELLKVRSRMAKDEKQHISSDPFYKIQKKRPQSIIKNKERPKIQLQSAKRRMMTDPAPQIPHQQGDWTGEDSSAEQRPRQILRQHFYPGEGEPEGIRGKSQTKIYEEIKKYFEEKYGSYQRQGKQ